MHTTPADRALFHQRGDANDVRLGEVVHTEPAAFAAADVIILGCPQDEGVRRNGGRPGAARGPDEIRRYLYRLSVNLVEPLQIFDLGNTRIQPALEATHALHQAVVQQVIAAGKRIIVLGGGNDIAYPDCAGLAAVTGAPLAFNIDAHFDVRLAAERNSGTPYRQLLDEGILAPEQFYQLGSQPFANSPIYRRYLHERGVVVHDMGMLRAAGIEATLRAILAQQHAPAIFWGLDMDVVRVADAPGVSAPNPLGLTGEEFCQVATIAGTDSRTRLIEISEVNPDYDLDGRTCRLAAAAIWHALAAWAAS
ncbi:MAG: formimidoylglutamase [Chloroflexaceae bacterium]|jgi:formiminoglutamase|nr:formimidoylglutamase [Chloroflexaceae bacterium]